MAGHSTPEYDREIAAQFAPPVRLPDALAGLGFGVAALSGLDALRREARVMRPADRMLLTSLCRALRSLAVAVDPSSGERDLRRRWYDDGSGDDAAAAEEADALVGGGRSARSVDDALGAPVTAAVVAAATALRRSPSCIRVLRGKAVWPVVVRLATAYVALAAG